MITDFKAFSLPHLFGLFFPVFLGILFIILAGKTKNEKEKKRLNLVFVCLLVLIRGSRYIMDLWFGRFDIFDLISLQICHIDLILLIVCLIRPSKPLFCFTFLIGIPMALSVALFPGRIHPEPGLARAVLFIMSHMMLVMGAVYLAAAEKIKLKYRYVLTLFGIGSVSIILLYFINRLLNTNFLYIMYAPKGTVIAKLDALFGWPGYIAAMDIIAFLVMSMVYLIYAAVSKIKPTRSFTTKLQNKTEEV